MHNMCEPKSPRVLLATRTKIARILKERASASFVEAHISPQGRLKNQVHPMDSCVAPSSEPPHDLVQQSTFNCVG